MQLKQGLDVAFLNFRKEFDAAQVACAELGAGWHAPASNSSNANPRVSDNSNSLEAVCSYVAGTTSHWFWSSSTVSSDTDYAWSVNLAYGGTLTNLKYDSTNVVCV